jgi:hypothetical protein
LLVVSLGVSLVCVRSVLADVEDSGFRIGRELLDLKDVLGPRQAVTVNGATLFAGARHSAQPVAAVLNLFEQHCTSHAGNFEAEFDRLSTSAKAALLPAVKDSKHLATVRREVADAGFVACIAAPGDARGFAGLTQRAQAFMDSGDLGKLGGLRLAFVRKAQGSDGSDVLTVWNEGPLDVMTMLLADGDVPGRDTPDVPRPEGSVRVLSAEVGSAPFGLRVFSTRTSVAKVLNTYDGTLPARGWRGVELGTPEARSQSRVFTKRGAAVFIDAENVDGETLLHVIELGSS